MSGHGNYGTTIHCARCGKRTRGFNDGVCAACCDGDANTYFDRREFTDYKAAVEDVIFDAAAAFIPRLNALQFPGLCTRDIHAALSFEARREWTMDALVSLKSLEKIPGLIDRWRPALGAERSKRKGARTLLSAMEAEPTPDADPVQVEAHKSTPAAAVVVADKAAPESVHAPTIAAGSGRLFNRKEISALVLANRRRSTTRQYRSSERTVKASSRY